jgi:hypothetical protein
MKIKNIEQQISKVLIQGEQNRLDQLERRLN